jgi:hypothetical protein
MALCLVAREPGKALTFIHAGQAFTPGPHGLLRTSFRIQFSKRWGENGPVFEASVSGGVP